MHSVVSPPPFQSQVTSCKSQHKRQALTVRVAHRSGTVLRRSSGRQVIQRNSRLLARVDYTDAVHNTPCTSMWMHEGVTVSGTVMAPLPCIHKGKLRIRYPVRVTLLMLLSPAAILSVNFSCTGRHAHTQGTRGDQHERSGAALQGFKTGLAVHDPTSWRGGDSTAGED
jgi:hypothetical protein